MPTLAHPATTATQKHIQLMLRLKLVLMQLLMTL
jgi:hypothetical protein